jgi:hypothetical protein
VAIRVVLAEDHYLVREGLQRLLESQPDTDEGIRAATHPDQLGLLVPGILFPLSTIGMGVDLCRARVAGGSA